MTNKPPKLIDGYFERTERGLFLENYDGIARLRREKKYGKAEALLLRAIPVPAVADELRKIASAQAWEARKGDDWPAVVKYLEGYLAYADRVRAQCVEFVNQEPPELTPRDADLLTKARQKVQDKSPT